MEWGNAYSHYKAYKEDYIVLLSTFNCYLSFYNCCCRVAHTFHELQHLCSLSVCAIIAHTANPSWRIEVYVYRLVWVFHFYGITNAKGEYREQKVVVSATTPTFLQKATDKRNHARKYIKEKQIIIEREGRKSWGS